MAKDPAFLFYSSDFLTGTILMSDEQVGKYIRLLCIQHQKGHLKESELIKMSCNDSDIMSKFVKDSEGLYYNIRLDYEANKRAEYCKSRRQNKLGNNTYDNTHDSTHDKDKCKQVLTHTYIRMENENENENRNDNESENEIKKREKEKKLKEKLQLIEEKLIANEPLSKYEQNLYYINSPENQKDAFETFWNTYDKKVDTKKCFDKWIKLNYDEINACIIAAGIYKSETQDKQFRKNPLTFLNGKCWQDYTDKIEARFNNPQPSKPKLDDKGLPI